MITSTDRAKYALPSKVNGKLTVVERADEEVDIRDVMKQMGVWAPTGSIGSYKIYCPWHEEHADPHDKNCRIYGTNNIYCFAMHGRITTSFLYSRWKGIPRLRAAEILLEERGLLHKSWREWWNELVILREDKYNKRLGSQTDVISSLHVLLEQHEVYVTHEFNYVVREAWQKVLEVLDKLWEYPQTDLAVLQQWYDKSLTRLLNAAHLAEGQTNDR